MAQKFKIFVECDSKTIDTHDIIAAIKDAWMEKGNLKKDLKEIEIYVKYEDRKAYFVAGDGNIKGHVGFTSDDMISSVVFDI